MTSPEHRLSSLLLLTFYLSLPTFSSCRLMSFQVGGRGVIPLLLRQPLNQRLRCLCTGSSSHMSVTYICPIILIHPSLHLSFNVRAPSSDPPSLIPRLPDSYRHCTLVASKIAYNPTLSRFSTVSCLHHGTRSVPPPS